MSGPPLTAATLERQLFDRYGLLLTQQQLAAFLGRPPRGFAGASPIPPMRAPLPCVTVHAGWGGACITPPARSPLSSLVVSAARRCHAHHHPRGASP